MLGRNNNRWKSYLFNMRWTKEGSLIDCNVIMSGPGWHVVAMLHEGYKRLDSLLLHVHLMDVG